MSALFYLLVLSAFSAAIADQELETFAQKVLELLNPNSDNSKTNGLLLQLTNGEHFSYNLLMGGNASESIRVNVTFSGSVQVSAQRDSEKVQVSTQYQGGAALAVNEKEDTTLRFSEPAEVDPRPVDFFLNTLYNKALESQNDAAEEDVCVLLAHGAKTGVKVRDNTRRAEAKINGGYIVGSKTKINKNY